MNDQYLQFGELLLACLNTFQKWLLSWATAVLTQ
jgi:hypothetical protein